MTNILTPNGHIEIDSIHPTMDELLTDSSMPIIGDVWGKKYRWQGEPSWAAMVDRVIDGVYAKDPDKEASHVMAKLMTLGLWMPGGRILAGAGTSKMVTLMNCYVNETMEDSMQGIHQALGNVMFTLQQGGGIGTDFSTLRPFGSQLRRTGPGSAASGPIPFMRTWNATSLTIKSAGDRRGAMMGTISDWHPDLPLFIKAKQIQGELEQFNVSVLVSDAFMEAVQDDATWMLYFSLPPAGVRNPEHADLDFTDEEGIQQYVYSVWHARELWDMIMQSTYDYAEPGVIFIDRVNDLNNLKYCEIIRCTNPCGEQPLPPNGACDLGAVNLARMVRNPFTDAAEFDFDLLAMTVYAGVRFLDNVIDVTDYPLQAQREEQFNKRRLGLGISGLADALAQLSLSYGSPKALRMVERIMKAIANDAYMASAMLANERGVFPLYDSEHINNAPFVQKLDEYVRQTIAELGLRNGVLLTIAPTGTISLVYGNIASGLEPTFAHEIKRKVFSSNAAHEAEVYNSNVSYTWRLWQRGNFEDKHTVPSSVFVTAQDLGIDAHLNTQGICQKWIDASISKTINLPKTISLEDFEAVYLRAYELGCKGCTTYRPSDVRGAVLEVAGAKAAKEDVAKSIEAPKLRIRPEFLQGGTYKVKWPSWNASVYVTINHTSDDQQPYEIFIVSKDARHQEWMTALTVMISAHMRRGGDLKFVVDELKAINSMHDGAFVGGRYYGSLPARIGEIIDQHLKRIGVFSVDSVAQELAAVVQEPENAHMMGEVCPSCSAPTMIREEGCYKCISCGFSKCG